MISTMVQEKYSDQSPNVVMLLGIYLHHDIQYYRNLHPDCKIIVYQLEPLCGTNHWWSRDSILGKLRHADEVWDYDMENVTLLRLHGINAHFKPFVHAESIISTSFEVEKSIDILFFGSLTERRMKILSQMTSNLNTDIKCHIVTNVLHPDIDRLVERSKVIVNIHHGDGVNQLEQPRVGYLLANGKHVVSEQSSINYYGDLISEFVDINDLVAKVMACISLYDPSNEVTIQQSFRNLTVETISQCATQTIRDRLTL